MNIEGIPETIERKAVLALVESLGIDWTNLISLRFNPLSIDAEVYAVNADGQRYFAPTIPEGPDEVATHKISIKVVDE